MANLAVILKEEIRRLARKEIKSNLGSTRQAVARYRREIAALKREIAQQAKKLAALSGRGSSGSNGTATSAVPASELDGVRFSPKSVRSQRRKLGLSAADYGKLVGVSALTVYNWEQAKSRPRQAQLARLVTVRNIGRREALARLA